MAVHPDAVLVLERRRRIERQARYVRQRLAHVHQCRSHCVPISVRAECRVRLVQRDVAGGDVLQERPLEVVGDGPARHWVQAGLIPEAEEGRVFDFALSLRVGELLGCVLSINELLLLRPEEIDDRRKSTQMVA
jgi:hypothetical protein